PPASVPCGPGDRCCSSRPAGAPSPYDEGRNLRVPTPRPCTCLGGSACPTRFRQCLFDRDHGASQSIAGGDGWNLVADVIDGNNKKHLCRLRRNDCGNSTQSVFDLTDDPNEKNDLYPASKQGFCKDQLACLQGILRYNVKDLRRWADGCTDTQWPTPGGCS